MCGVQKDFDFHFGRFASINKSTEKRFHEIFFPRKTILREKFFGVRENFRKKFLGKSVHTLFPQTRIIHNCSKTPKNPSKPKFSDVNSIAGCQGHLRPESPKNPAIVNAKKTMPLKAR